MHDWYWAAEREGPAGDRFVIENGKEALWRRVRSDIDVGERVMWAPIHKGSQEPNMSHVMHILLSVVPTYRVSHNRFVFEAAKIPCFAHFLRNAPGGLPEYVSNSAYPEIPLLPEPYTHEAAYKLGSIVSATLGIDPDWMDL